MIFGKRAKAAFQLPGNWLPKRKNPAILKQIQKKDLKRRPSWAEKLFGTAPGNAGRTRLRHGRSRRACRLRRADGEAGGHPWQAGRNRSGTGRSKTGEKSLRRRRHALRERPRRSRVLPAFPGAVPSSFSAPEGRRLRPFFCICFSIAGFFPFDNQFPGS